MNGWRVNERVRVQSWNVKDKNVQSPKKRLSLGPSGSDSLTGTGFLRNASALETERVTSGTISSVGIGGTRARAGLQPHLVVGAPAFGRQLGGERGVFIPVDL